MLKREEQLLVDLKRLASAAMKAEIAALKRAVKKASEDRDHWRETARRYQKQILELKR